MSVLAQIGIIFLFGLGGQLLEQVLPFNMPASVLALLLLLAALRLGLISRERLGQTADFISANMAFFFLPSAVAIMGEFSSIRTVLLPLLVIIIATTLVTFGVTYAVTALVQRLMAGKR